jgi:hypothetical protein
MNKSLDEVEVYIYIYPVNSFIDCSEDVVL